MSISCERTADGRITSAYKQFLDKALPEFEKSLDLSIIKDSLLVSDETRLGLMTAEEHNEVFSAGKDKQIEKFVHIIGSKLDDSTFEKLCTLLEYSGQHSLSWKLKGEVDFELVQGIGLEKTMRFFLVKKLTMPNDGGASIIDRGSFGSVVRASWNDIPCAVKVFHKTVANNEEYEKHFHREVYKWALNLRHPNIVQFYGIYIDEEGCFSIVMELLETNLQVFLKSREVNPHIVPLKLKRAILLDICNAMVYLHGHNIMHRDLKSSNILLSCSLVAKISDFGTSRKTVENGVFTVLPGTAAFNAPETSKFTYGPQVDVFSYGCIILQIMTHKFPEPAMVSRNEYQKREHWLSNVNLKYYEELPELVKRCLSDEPYNRPTFDEIHQMLSSQPYLTNSERLDLIASELEHKEPIINGYYSTAVTRWIVAIVAVIAAFVILSVL